MTFHNELTDSWQDCLGRSVREKKKGGFQLRGSMGKMSIRNEKMFGDEKWSRNGGDHLCPTLFTQEVCRAIRHEKNI